VQQIASIGFVCCPIPPRSGRAADTDGIAVAAVAVVDDGTSTTPAAAAAVVDTGTAVGVVAVDVVVVAAGTGTVAAGTVAVDSTAAVVAAGTVVAVGTVVAAAATAAAGGKRNIHSMVASFRPHYRTSWTTRSSRHCFCHHFCQNCSGHSWWLCYRRHSVVAVAVVVVVPYGQ
jgi:hypothetical protein